MADSTSDLKDCPFCAYTDPQKAVGMKHAMIYCPDCQVEMDAPTEEEAITKWNRREWIELDLEL